MRAATSADVMPTMRFGFSIGCQYSVSNRSKRLPRTRLEYSAATSTAKTDGFLCEYCGNRLHGASEQRRVVCAQKLTSEGHDLSATVGNCFWQPAARHFRGQASSASREF